MLRFGAAVRWIFFCFFHYKIFVFVTKFGRHRFEIERKKKRECAIFHSLKKDWNQNKILINEERKNNFFFPPLLATKQKLNTSKKHQRQQKSTSKIEQLLQKTNTKNSKTQTQKVSVGFLRRLVHCMWGRGR